MEENEYMPVNKYHKMVSREKEEKLLQLIEDTEDIDDILYYQIKLINHYLKTNQLDKRKAVYAEYVDLVKTIQENNIE